jgi:hypothetical protein
MGGFNQAFQAGLSQQSDKSRLSDEEHQQALQEKNQSIAALQAKMAEVGPNHPEYAGLQDQLSRVMEDRTALYHPNQPGGLERLGAALWELGLLSLALWGQRNSFQEPRQDQLYRSGQ